MRPRGRLRPVPVLSTWVSVVGFWLLVAFVGALWIIFAD